MFQATTSSAGWIPVELHLTSTLRGAATFQLTTLFALFPIHKYSYCESNLGKNRISSYHYLFISSKGNHRNQYQPWKKKETLVNKSLGIAF